MNARALLILLLISTAGSAAHAADRADDPPAAQRPRIGVAFGGGSARGLAHVGVVRWFEEHRIPIDLIAGTSMGGLIGGAVASGMSSRELTALLDQVNWDEMFGFSPFRYKNIRRKEDARAYPSRIEFGVKNGLGLPIALNNGQQVDFLLARIAGPYATMASFDQLPTPFRAVAVDLVAGEQVVVDRGSLSAALRSTMSLPGIFPPVEYEGRVLVDGGAMNNVPADVVRAMGADFVIAINVGAQREEDVSRSMLGLIGQTVDIMMLASTRTAMKSADIVITPELADYSSLDWRRSAQLEAEGYRAAEALKERLLPLALDEAAWDAYLAARRERRKTTWPAPRFVTVEGAVAGDRARMEMVLAPLVGEAALDVPTLETTLEAFTGLDRYETVGWRLDERDGQPGLRVEARPKVHAPPFLMLGVSLQNTTTDDFEFQLAARYLTFDAVGSGSELRIDGALGVDPSIAAELYRPLGRSPLFATAAAGARRQSLSFVDDDTVIARYTETRTLLTLGGGVNLGRDNDVRLAIALANLDASVHTGDPGLPELHGREVRARLAWRHDGQDSVVAPSGGMRAEATIHYVIESPDAPPDFVTDRSTDDVTQAEWRSSHFWSRQRHRVFAAVGAGTTWGHPYATDQFALGAPLRLGAYDSGTQRGDHYAVIAGGYLHAVGRLPDFLGGSYYLGGWIENGSAFNELDTAEFKTNFSIGALADTLLGPVLLGSSWDANGAWRYYIGIGRLF